MIVCLIQVMAFHFFSNVHIEGRIITKNEKNYLVDFSEEAKKKHYDGDYSKIIVSKDKCVELK